MTDLTKVWQAFDNGDHLSDDDLNKAIVQASAAVLYLEQRGPQYGLALEATRRDLSRLEGYQRARHEYGRQSLRKEHG